MDDDLEEQNTSGFEPRKSQRKLKFLAKSKRSINAITANRAVYNPMIALQGTRFFDSGSNNLLPSYNLGLS